MSVCRLTIVCSALTISADTTIGSMPFHGREPWLWRPGHEDPEEVGAGHQRAGPQHRPVPVFSIEPTCRRERGVRLRDREQPFVQHERRAAALALRHAFLGGLEDEQHLARQPVAQLHQHSATPIRIAVWAS